MLVPFNAAGEAAAPVARLQKAALEGGLYLMTHWNMIMIVPPLTITREELDEGLGPFTALGELNAAHEPRAGLLFLRFKGRLRGGLGRGGRLRRRVREGDVGMEERQD